MPGLTPGLSLSGTEVCLVRVLRRVLPSSTSFLVMIVSDHRLEEDWGAGDTELGGVGSSVGEVVEVEGRVWGKLIGM